MTPSKTLYITTSWDDGHPSDMRLAELLHKYGLKATFYVPLHNDRKVLSRVEMRTLSHNFEIGGHTVHHCDLRAQTSTTVQQEITECKRALEDVTSQPCRSFCFPLGRFRWSHLKQVRAAGFSLARTVELMSLDAPRLHGGLAVMPTTLQAVPIRPSAYVKNSCKRLRPKNLLLYARNRRSTWVAMLASILAESSRRGGILHLWGHSWEINEYSDWSNLESAFAMLAQAKNYATFVSNGQLLTELSNSNSK